MKSTRSVVFAVYVLFVMTVSVHNYFRPEYSWDLMGYIGVVLSYEEQDRELIHQEAYQNLQAIAPLVAYNQICSGNKYRIEVAHNFESYHQQLSFYTVKPLYTISVYLFWKAGVNIIHATVLVSILSFIFSCVVIFLWLAKTLDGYILLAASLFITLIANLPYIGRLPTPDSLSGAILLGALYQLLERKSKLAFAILLSLSILARPDNIILISLLLLYLTFFTRRDFQITSKQFAATGLVAMCIYVAVFNFNYHYGWSTLFYHTFVENLNYPAEQSVSVSFADYILSLTKGIRDIIFRTPFTSFSFFAFFTFASAFLRKLTPNIPAIQLDLNYLMLFSVILHFLLFPHAGAVDRFSLAQFTHIGIVFVIQLASLWRIEVTHSPM